MKKKKSMRDYEISPELQKQFDEAGITIDDMATEEELREHALDPFTTLYGDVVMEDGRIIRASTHCDDEE